MTCNVGETTACRSAQHRQRHSAAVQRLPPHCRPALTPAAAATAAGCQMWMDLSSEAEANMAGSAGFQATLFTVPLWPSSSSSRSPAGRGGWRMGGSEDTRQASTVLAAAPQLAATMAAAGASSSARKSNPRGGSRQTLQYDPNQLQHVAPVWRWYTYTLHSSEPVSTKRSSRPPRQERTTNRLCLSCTQGGWAGPEVMFRGQGGCGRGWCCAFVASGRNRMELVPWLQN